MGEKFLENFEEELKKLMKIYQYQINAEYQLELLLKVQMLATLLTIGYLKNRMGIISIKF